MENVISFLQLTTLFDFQSLQSWKEWQENALLMHSRLEEKRPPNSLLQTIVQFVQSSISVKELERIFRLHVSRAKARIQGLNFFHQMLTICSFGSVRQQVLNCIGRPLYDGGHYLDNVQTCGKELAQTVAEAFSALFDQMTNIIRDPSIDAVSRLLALNVCGMAFQEYDTHLLIKAKIFSLLRQIMSEKPKTVAVGGSLSPTERGSSHFKAFSGSRTEDKRDLPTTVGTMTQETESKSSEGGVQIGKEKKPLGEEDKTAKDPRQNESEKKRQEEDQESIQELQRQQTLRCSAWTAFRLLATQCISWMMSEDLQSMTLVDRNAISKLHDHIFDLMCEELKRLVEHTKQKTSQSFPNVRSSLDHTPQGTLSLLLGHLFFSIWE